MNLFDPAPNKVAPAQIKQLKAWVHDALAVAPSTPISISQLQCSEPGCPPLETVIAVMSLPPKTYKIHRPATEIVQADIRLLAESSEGNSSSDCSDSKGAK